MRINSHFFRYRFPAIAWALLIFLASSIPSAKLPSLKILDFDKLLHISVFFVFGVLVYRALQPRDLSQGFRWSRVFIAIGVVIAYGIIDELHQSFVPGRTLDFWDLCADATGGLFAGILVWVRRNRTNNTQRG